MVYSDTKKLIYMYINGVLTGVIQSTASDSFTINTTNIVFNSEYCDIDLYKIRTYNTDLDISAVLKNYAVDFKDITIFDQNALADFNGAIEEYQFKFNKMIDYNNNHPDQ
jgi:hypothetical protein